MPEPRWLVDEMLGRLARYLRFFGYDTAYVRALADAQVIAQSELEGRTIITRDRELARAVPGSILLDSPRIDAQLRALRAARPELQFDVRFDRCTTCNGPLRPWAGPGTAPRPDGIPSPEALAGRTVFECGACGKLFWEGSHTRQIRRQLEQWLGEAPSNAV